MDGLQTITLINDQEIINTVHRFHLVLIIALTVQFRNGLLRFQIGKVT